MAKLCGRPGCSEPGAVTYGMVPEDLLFWVAPIDPYASTEVGVLCRRHADAMSVPRGWTLDDRRETVPRLFRPSPMEHGTSAPPAAPRRRRVVAAEPERVEQLELDGTQPEGIERPQVADEPESQPAVAAGWSPAFDVDDDLDGLLEVSSPLLARAFRGSARPRS